MATLIFFHLTDKVSVYKGHNGNYLGEIFNIDKVNPETCKVDHSYLSPYPSSEIWSQRWTLKYILHLDEVFLRNPDAFFIARIEDFFYSKAACALIEKIQPTIYNVFSNDELASIKKNIITKKTFGDIPGPFTATLNEFVEAHQMCVLYPKAVHSFFRVNASFTLNELPNPEVELLENSSQIDEWYKVVCQK